MSETQKPVANAPPTSAAATDPSQSAAPQKKSSNDHLFYAMHSPTGGLDAPTFAKSGKLVVEWYLSLFGALSTMGTLGAGFTLSVVVLSPPTPSILASSHFAFTPETITTFAAISSILFVLTVLVSQGCAQLFRFEQSCIAEGVDNDEALVLWSLAGLSLLLQVQVLGAFVFLELVLTAHEPVVGWVGIGLTAALGVVALFLWGLQATGRKPVARFVVEHPRAGTGLQQWKDLRWLTAVTRFRRYARPRKRRGSSERQQEGGP